MQPGVDARLPTRLQWEATCRAAFPGARQAGEFPETLVPFLQEKDLAQVAWFRENSAGGIHPVAKLQPDGLGLYDLLGNVNEWGDKWTESTRYKSQDGTAVTILLGLMAGGSYRYSATQFACQANMYSDLLGANDTGIRLVMPAYARK